MDRDAKLTEAQIEDQILTWLNLQGHFAFKVPDQRRHTAQGYKKEKWQPRGIPDIICITKSGVVWLEVKTMTGTLSEHQKKFQAILGQFKERFAVVRSLQEVKSLFAGLITQKDTQKLSQKAV